jgi:hypothetical protein
MNSGAKQNKARVLARPAALNYVGDGWKIVGGQIQTCYSPSADSSGRVWKWKLSDYDKDSGHIRLVTLSTNGSANPVYITITQKWVEIDFATMKVGVKKLNGIERHCLDLSEDIANGTLSPLDPKVTRQKIRRLWNSSWENVLRIYATETMDKLETGNIDPSTVSQYEKLYIGWRTDRSGHTKFSNFEKFVADNIDFGLERSRTKQTLCCGRPTGMRVPLSITAEQEFYQIDILERIWSNKQKLMNYIKSAGTGNFNVEKTIGSDGDMKTQPLIGVDNTIPFWEWKLSDYDPVTSTVARMVYKSDIFNDIVRTNVRLELDQLRVRIPFSNDETQMIWLEARGYNGSPLSIESDTLRMYIKPAVREARLDTGYAKVMRGNREYNSYSPEVRRYVGWRHHRSKTGDDVTWTAYTTGKDGIHNPRWAEWEGPPRRRRSDDDDDDSGAYQSKTLRRDARLIYV